jgi:LmbE family N-acetylglucosaminyl deacetylase
MDDAALSCGRLLAALPGSHVVTVFSGGPAGVSPLPEWDRLSGAFSPGDDVMGLRALEDEAALTLVGATGHRLGLWDEQYRERPLKLARFRAGAVRARRRRLDDPRVEDDAATALAEVAQDLPVRTWVVPLGLWHGDHEKTARACLRLATRPARPDRPAPLFVVYEELPYRLDVPERVDQAKAGWSVAGFELEPVAAPGLGGEARRQAKAAMVAAYRSQLPCLGTRAHLAVDADETYHLLRPVPTG